MSDFLRIKKAIDTERTKKTQGEARQQTLTEEAGRIALSIKQDTGSDIADVSVNLKQAVVDGQSLAANTEKVITESILELKKLLDAEGVAY